MHPPISVNNFELKLSLIGMVQHDQFSGLPSENPNLLLSTFVDNCGTAKANGIDQIANCLSLFPFSLRDYVQAWI